MSLSIYTVELYELVSFSRGILTVSYVGRVRLMDKISSFILEYMKTFQTVIQTWIVLRNQFCNSQLLFSPQIYTPKNIFGTRVNSFPMSLSQ